MLYCFLIGLGLAAFGVLLIHLLGIPFEEADKDKLNGYDMVGVLCIMLSGVLLGTELIYWLLKNIWAAIVFTYQGYEIASVFGKADIFLAFAILFFTLALIIRVNANEVYDKWRWRDPHKAKKLAYRIMFFHDTSWAIGVAITIVASIKPGILLLS